MELNSKYKECRSFCSGLRQSVSENLAPKETKFDSAERIMYNFALKTAEEAAEGDSNGELEHSDIVQRYETAANLLQVHSNAPSLFIPRLGHLPADRLR